ncbi:DUF4864 domain-containing protein [Celeribacter arenosi]|uniref:DUF4864 domain-containing protein n=1 Tax=Celeribacter arenosi TaxID=792649 RepID=A0ABP7K6P9_9RHOB
MFAQRISATLFALCLPLSAMADAVTDVISDQLGAFAARDVARAWGHASPMIQGMFGSPENFEMMVRNGYSVIWDNRGATFSERIEQDGRLRQTVVIKGEGGALQAFEYDMVETDAGWKINGVRPVEMPDFAV